MKINTLILIFCIFVFFLYSQKILANYEINDPPECFNNKGEPVKFVNMKSKTGKITIGIAKKDALGKPIIYRFNYDKSSKFLQQFIDYHECAHHQTGDLEKTNLPQNSKDYLLKEDIADCIATIRTKSDHLNAKNLILITIKELKKAMTYIGFDELAIKRREDNILKCFNKNISLTNYIEDIFKQKNFIKLK
jgi:hypothetical protein